MYGISVKAGSNANETLAVCCQKNSLFLYARGLAEGFPQTLHTPLSFITPIQFPSLQRILSETPISFSPLSSCFTGFPHLKQKRLPSGVWLPHSEQSKKGKA